MITKFSIEFDKEIFSDKILESTKQLNKISRRIMGAILSAIKKIQRKKVSGEVLRVDSGVLKKSFRFSTYSDFTGVLKNKAFYASFQEEGIAVPKRNFVLQPHPFFYDVINDFMNTTEPEDKADVLMMEYLDSIWESK